MQSEFSFCLSLLTDIMVVQMVKNLPTMQETWVRSLGQEDPLEKGMATTMDRGAWWATVHGVAESDTTNQLNHHHHHEVLQPL